MVIEKTSVGLSQMFLLYWRQFWRSLFCLVSLMLCESSCDWAEASGDAMVFTRSRGLFMAVVSLGVIAMMLPERVGRPRDRRHDYISGSGAVRRR